MILIADDESFQREFIKILFEQFSEESVLTAADYAEVNTLLETEKEIKLLILDLKMPGMSGVKSVEELCRVWPKLPVLVVSAHDDPLTIKSCVEAGASGFVSKVNGAGLLQDAIQQVLCGNTFFPNNIMSEEGLKLSQKQMEILYLLVEGCSNQEIAERTCLANGTVKQYVSDILTKMKVDNRVKAAIRAQEILGV